MLCNRTLRSGCRSEITSDLYGIKHTEVKGIVVERFNLSNAPQAFVDNQVVNDFINRYGVDHLPITLVEGEIRAIGHYPTNEEFTEWLGLPVDVLGVSVQDKNTNGCCCKGGCC